MLSSDIVSKSAKREVHSRKYNYGTIVIGGGGVWRREGMQGEAGLGDVHSDLVSKEGSRREVGKDLIKHIQCFQFDAEGMGAFRRF